MRERGVYAKYKVAAVQSGMALKEPPDWFDLDASIDKAVRIISEAGAAGARLVVFPETWLPGHPTLVNRLSEALGEAASLWRAYVDNGIRVPGPEIDALCTAARKAGVFVAMGINELDRERYGAMYNSIVYIGPEGQVLGTHRKITNTAAERLFHSPGWAGDNLRTVFPTELGMLGGSMCGEHSQYLLQYLWIHQGLEVSCSLWPGYTSIREPMQARVRGICATSAIFSVLSATWMPQEEYPRIYGKTLGARGTGTLCGGSGIVGPQGTFLVGPVFDQETTVYGEIDLADIPKRRSNVNLTGLYDRSDLLSLHVREDTFQPVVHTGGNGESSPQLARLEQRVAELEHELRISRHAEARPAPERIAEVD